MKKIMCLLALVICCTGYSQKAPEGKPVPLLPTADIPKFVDSIKMSVLQDTIKFKRADLVHLPIGSQNTKSYSPLFFVNIRYEYKLDIVNGAAVMEFVREILDPSKIESVAVVDEGTSLSKFGSYGKNGVVLINLKDSAKVNFEVAGLVSDGKKGDNFNQRQKGELLIHN